MSNGCFWCDALLGNFFLYAEHLPAVLVTEGLAGLCPLIEVTVGLRRWQLLRAGRGGRGGAVLPLRPDEGAGGKG